MNLRPLHPQCSALPGCATLRLVQRRSLSTFLVQEFFEQKLGKANDARIYRSCCDYRCNHARYAQQPFIHHIAWLFVETGSRVLFPWQLKAHPRHPHPAHLRLVNQRGKHQLHPHQRHRVTYSPKLSHWLVLL